MTPDDFAELEELLLEGQLAYEELRWLVWEDEVGVDPVVDEEYYGGFES